MQTCGGKETDNTQVGRPFGIERASKQIRGRRGRERKIKERSPGLKEKTKEDEVK